ncbi:MAG TPA: glycosyltransferase [Chitinophagaceae bacterium]|nr:glycosyltransferase [Chitinophagaceae bacterium]
MTSLKPDKRILVIGKFDKESFASHVVQTLQDMGHEVRGFHYGVHYSHRKSKAAFAMTKFKLLVDNFLWNTAYHERKIRKSLKVTVEEAPIGLTIVTHDFLKPSEVDLIADLTKAPVVLWFPDALVNMGRHMFLNANYDVQFFKDPFLVARLQSDFPNKKIFYLPECCNPRVHKLYETQNGDAEKFACDITTAGNLYSNRVAFFEQLSDMNLDIKIWGNPGSRWMKLDKIKSFLKSEYVMEREKGVAFRLAKIVLNNLHPGEVAGINCRAFEVPAMGGFQMINHRDGIEDLFVPGEEIITFQSLDDLKSKIQYFLDHDHERAAIAEKGYHRAQAEHTYRKRLELMMKTVFEGGSGFKLPNN